METPWQDSSPASGARTVPVRQSQGQSRIQGFRDRGTILVVDDVPSNIHILSHILREDHQVYFSTNGPDALRIAKEKRPDLVLLDIMMPEMDGYEVCRRLREQPETRDIPIIFVTALGEEKDEAKGLELGAIDYFIKPLSPPIVRVRVRNHLELKRQRDALRDMSQVDGLTGLANRRRFDEALDREWRRSLRAGTPISLIIADIDHFKDFNDHYGHLKGDECLRKVARTVAGYLCRPGDLAARFGDKQIAALLPETAISGAKLLGEQAQQAVEALAIQHSSNTPTEVVTLSVGVSCCVPVIDLFPAQLVAMALEQVRLAKDAGRNCLKVEPL